MKAYWIVALACCAGSLPALATTASGSGSGEASTSTAADYVLGPEDVISITAHDAEEIGSRPVRVENDGAISLPLLGRVQAAGLSAEQLEKVLEKRLAAYVKSPRVSITITEFGSEPVSITGAVAAPGIHQAKGTMKLLDLVSVAGGLRPDAGYSIRITRERKYGALPLETARDDESGRFSTAEINVDSLLKGEDPRLNVSLRPHDTVFVPSAEIVYVIGEVHKPGGFTVRRQDSLSALTALSMAEGLLRTAAPQHARILRRVSDSPKRLEITINLQKLLVGKIQDVPLQRDDILFVPDSKAKRISARTAEAALQVATGIAIFGR